jgi:RNA polymerase sigma-70 factor (family 1)
MDEYQRYDEGKLLFLLKKEDHQAYTEIFKRYNKLLYSHAYNKIRNTDDAKDIIQQIFYSLWLNRSQVNIDKNLAVYLFTSVRYKIADYFSKKSTRDKYIQSLGSFIETHQESTDYLVRRKQMSEIITEEIAALPPRMREVFELSRNNHLSYKEISAQLNISEETVKDQIKKALKILRVRLGLFAFICFLIGRF